MLPSCYHFVLFFVQISCMVYYICDKPNRNGMNIFNSAWNKLRDIWNLGGYAPDPSGRLDFFATRGLKDIPDVTVDFTGIGGLGEAYARCSSLRSIINKNSQALTNGKWWVVDKKDNDAINKYAGIKKLLRRPNPLQSWSEFIMLVDVMRQVYGEVFVHADVPVGFGVRDASALWVINPSMIDIELTGKMYFQSKLSEVVSGYYLSDGINRTRLEDGEVLHIRDTSQNVMFGNENVRGLSRLVGLENTLKNIIMAEEAIYSLNKDRGAQGMLVNKTKDVSGSVPMTPGEKERIQADYKLRYGLREGADKIIITNADLDWRQLTFSVKDLMLFEGITYDIQRLCDAFDYPYEMIASTNGVTYANRLEAKRDYYQNTVIPLANYYAEAFSRFFGLNLDSFVVDFSEVECLKRSEQEKADALYKLNQAYKIMVDSGAASVAEWRLAAGMDEDIYKPDKTREDGQDTEDTTEEGRGGE